jgi:glyoxylase-like metal-dependent hydrolase (beta-lactamase superfamily II)
MSGDWQRHFISLRGRGKSMPDASRMSRRAMLQSGAAAAVCGFGASLRSGGAHAQATQPSPATHRRFALGQREIIVLSDGHLEFPAEFLARNVAESEVRSFLAARNLRPDRIRFHINVALIKTGDNYTLIDAGSGSTWEQSAGKLADSLEAAGIAPDQIGTLVITHAHPDHLWGLVDDFDDSLRFPRARYLVPAREFEFWTGSEAAAITGPIEGIAAGARRVFRKIGPRTTRIKPGEEIAPGIAAIDTAGHTPGHISALVTSGTEKLLVTADAIQNAHVSFAHPDWHPRADMDGDRAAQSRRRLLDMAATDKLRVLSYHIPFPGLGRVERKDSAYSWARDT